MRALNRLFSATVISILLLSGLTAQVSASTPSFMLNNEKIRFGGGGQDSTSYTFTDSFANSGMPEQPFYKSASGKWFKLTYSSIPMSMTLGSGTGGSNWSGASVPTSDSFDSSMGLNTLSGFSVDLANKVSRSPSQSVDYGYGSVTVSGTVLLNGESIGVRHVYELGQNDSFVKATTTLTNNHSSQVNNLMIWIGTRDDWVGVSDGPKKERGNIADGSFSKITNRSDPSSAIRITTATEGILFYSTTPQTRTAIDSCCSFENAYNRSPSSSEIELTGDGSYAISLPVGNLASGASSSITWFYAAGPIADLAEVVRSVASASAPTAPSVASADSSVTASWTAPTSDDPIVGYRLRYSTNNGASWVTHNSDFDTSSLSRTIAGLTNGTSYLFQVAALTGDLNNSPTLGTWSASSAPVIPGGASAPTISSVTAGNGKLTVAYSGSSSTGGFPITEYEYSTDNGATWLSSGSTSSPLVISGLTNGTTYQVKLRAKGSFAGVPSSASSGSPQATVASAPSITSVQTLDGELLVNFVPPLDNGGSSITNYKYSTDGVSYRLLSPSQTTSPISITKLSSDGSTNLTNGSAYQISLKAVNSIGDSAASSTSVATPKASQGAVWSPEKTSFSYLMPMSITPYPAASSDGPGTIEYSVVNAGASDCQVNSSTGAITFSRTGVCKVRATSLETLTHKASFVDIDFNLEVVVAVQPPALTPTPTPTPTRAPRVIRSAPRPTATPQPSPSPAVSASPSTSASSATPVAMPREEVEQLSSQLGVKFTEQGLPELKPLQSIGFVDRAPIPVTLNPNPTNTGLVVDGDGFTISLAASNSEGASQDLTSDGRLIIGRQNLATFSGTGFSPNSEVKIWLFSNPIELGTVKTDGNGNFEGSLPLPSEIAVGEHTVQLNGLSKAGEERSVSVGVLVADAPVLVPSDSSLGAFMVVFGLLALATLWFILWRRRRADDESSDARKPLSGRAPIRRAPAADVVNSN